MRRSCDCSPNADEPDLAEVLRILEIGLHHEQQHQELLLTDILHAFAQNPIAPAYDPDWQAPRPQSSSRGFVDLPSGIHSIGFAGEGYCFDNEEPAHQVLLQPARIARGLVTNAQWLEFMADGGYRTPSLWLSDGWAAVEAEGWDAPGYWQQRDGVWLSLTLGGLRAGRSGRAGEPRELLRGRRLRALGRQAPADRGGMGSRGACRVCSTTPSASSGNGPAAPICLIRAIAPPTARSANTTASS